VIGFDNVCVVHCQHELHLVFNSLAGFTVMLDALDGNLTARPTACTPTAAIDSNSQQSLASKPYLYPLGQAVSPLML
jgi:hypothetical protein